VLDAPTKPSFSFRKLAFPGLWLGLGLLVGPAGAFAADTIEVWEPGALDVEFHAGVERWTWGGGETHLMGETVVGVGLPNRVSAFVALAGEYREALEEPDLFPTVGAFWTPLETHHLDADLLLGLTSDGEGAVALEPGFEVNLDSSQDMGGLGGYLRGGTSLAGVGGQLFTDPTADRHDLDLELTYGAYVRATDRNQLLLEFQQVFHQLETNGLTDPEPLALGLGWNHTLNPKAELIFHAFKGFKHQEAPQSWGGSLGVILTVE
jgi:hypothetical protein